MLLVYTNEAEMERATADLMKLVAEGHRKVMEEARRAGVFVVAEKLAHRLGNHRPGRRRTVSGHRRPVR
jgi:hypothetical protein